MSDTQNGLPPAREAIIDQAHRLHQEVAHERDMLRLFVADLQTKISGLEAQLALLELEASQQKSKAESALSIRDDAVAERAVYETLFISVQAQLRAFRIPAAPLIKERNDEVDDGAVGDGSLG
jgi:hypothetical protein